ncbi:hypothetical protein FV139_17160 [Parahaliea maris]|uniref:Uncharacterized protein n=1 Tax=Parahaliea maris TaxID=2716870 RepID=A0A5C8ZSJ1_9GAMM|nr:hypothetical protein [Parahaliea maris]TXS90709.1 hypothetical protein FV139_17160 [Parahaliea maris]
MATIKKERLIFGLYLLALIVVIELILHRFHLPAWPVFLVMILFFECHMDRSRAPHLLLGGLVGIGCYMLTVEFVQLAAPLLGVATARLAFICLVVYTIVAVGEAIPWLFNNYAFMFFLVSGLAATTEGAAPAPLAWMGVEVVGGIFVLVGVLGIRGLLARGTATQ